jgi:hypothetical protein
MNIYGMNLVGKYKINENGCWIWQHSKQNQGYGVSSFQGKKMLAHRLSYMERYGEIPNGKSLDHLCRVPACINPDHLEPVTHRENIMRSPSAAAALNARKTHCKNGHEYTPENTYTRQRKGRMPERDCITCRNKRNASRTKKTTVL